MILESDITGAWVHENAVPLGGGVMRMSSCWVFDVGGGATFATEAILEHEGRVVVQDASRYVGRWSVSGDTLVVELSEHTDSPFRLSVTDSGELASGRHSTWRRPISA